MRFVKKLTGSTGVRDILRGFGLVVLAAAVPACSYGSSGHSYMAPSGPGGPPGTTTILSDSFFPDPGTAGSNWVAPTTTNSATTSVTFPAGGYILTMHAPTRTAGTAPTALTRTSSTFGPTTVSLSMDIQTSSSSTVGDIGSVVIEQAGAAHTVLARADLNANTMMLGVSVGGGTVTNTVVTAGTFYTVLFKVDSSGNASWSVNGGTATSPVVISTAAMIDMAVEANWAMGVPSPSPDFIFRKLLVTTP